MQPVVRSFLFWSQNRNSSSPGHLNNNAEPVSSATTPSYVLYFSPERAPFLVTVYKIISVEEGGEDGSGDRNKSCGWRPVTLERSQPKHTPG